MDCFIQFSFQFLWSSGLNPSLTCIKQVLPQLSAPQPLCVFRITPGNSVGSVNVSFFACYYFISGKTRYW